MSSGILTHLPAARRRGTTLSSCWATEEYQNLRAWGNSRLWKGFSSAEVLYVSMGFLNSKKCQIEVWVNKAHLQRR